MLLLGLILSQPLPSHPLSHSNNHSFTHLISLIQPPTQSIIPCSNLSTAAPVGAARDWNNALVVLTAAGHLMTYSLPDIRLTFRVERFVSPSDQKWIKIVMWLHYFWFSFSFLELCIPSQSLKMVKLSIYALSLSWNDVFSALITCKLIIYFCFSSSLSGTTLGCNHSITVDS